ncbi:hypothetical protein SAMN05443287_101955 [Micromonospora phaseoli]|uniref:Right handed beta helix region n=1 Tax=Micromonospora phaseoli TaxID=1144548 RepID=A0A1H6T7K2_9ACTN|nr:hypothetical protein [Micromonospora phaseoli]PZW04201.1 hypothetical protein CLV64_101955 [Micromonospora phaseoli]GIJ79389.1 hypothetical protein Xph01_38210 [Micromonospora phaseoli]SEI74134.1 hypothetical protein SAMN05443287_101955 [Micromonospora phaseoli]
MALGAALTALVAIAVGGAVAASRMADRDADPAAATGGTPDPAVPSASLPEPSSPAPGASAGLGTRPNPSASVTASAKASAAASSASAALTGFPGAGNTGVPAGVQLARYSGPCTITKAGTVIDKRHVSCSLLIKAKDVVIRSSRVDGAIRLEGGSYSVRIEDAEIDGGQDQVPAVGFENVTVLRSELRGGQASVNCYRNCHVQDSWLHSQHLPDGGDWHLNAFLSNGGSDIRLVHNTLSCDQPNNAAGGGCTANASIFGDFGPNTNYTIQDNLFVASAQMSYCFYGGFDEHKDYGTQVSGIVVTGNVFQRGKNGKCGGYGPATSWARSAPGNVWRGNVWSDGKPLPPD